jgi:hypothetical protein
MTYEPEYDYEHEQPTILATFFLLLVFGIPMLWDACKKRLKNSSLTRRDDEEQMKEGKESN